MFYNQTVIADVMPEVMKSRNRDSTTLRITKHRVSMLCYDNPSSMSFVIISPQTSSKRKRMQMQGMNK